MASIARNKANRANAQRSTGPRTEDGKAAAKYNRTCHGLAGKQIVLASESAEAYDALRADLMEAYEPANNAEVALVEEIAQNFWRIQRGRAVEAETFNLQCAGADPVIGFHAGCREFENLRRYMGAIERAYHRALTQLSLEQAARRKREAEQPAAPKPILGKIRIVHRPPPPKAIPIGLPEYSEPAMTPPQPVDIPPPS